MLNYFNRVGMPGPANEVFNSKSELSRPEQQAVHGHRMSQEDYGRAFPLLSEACRTVGLGLPNHSDVEMAAKILGALPESRIPRAVEPSLEPSDKPHALWLLTESYILQGKDPAPIHLGAMKSILGGGLFDK